MLTRGSRQIGYLRRHSLPAISLLHSSQCSCQCYELPKLVVNHQSDRGMQQLPPQICLTPRAALLSRSCLGISQEMVCLQLQESRVAAKTAL